MKQLQYEQLVGKLLVRDDAERAMQRCAEILAADIDRFPARVDDRTRTAFTSVQRRMRSLAASALRLTGVTSAGLIAARAVSDAVTFHSELTKIVTLVGVAEKQVAAWRTELLELAPALGKSPVELARALFSITSAGLRGSAAIEALSR